MVLFVSFFDMTLTLTKFLAVATVSLLTAVTPTDAWTLDRRTAIQTGGAGLATLIGGPAASFAGGPTSAFSVPKNLPVLVLGANGGTGRECVRALLEQGRTCIATTRSGDVALEPTAALLTTSVDVTSYESLMTAMARQPLGAVIFAASASTKGGDAFAVDRDGVIAAARACVANNVPRFVIVSSGTVTRPDAAVYQLLNLVGHGIMEAKIQGEAAVRDLYADPDVIGQKMGYTVVRPGGLTTGESLGAASLELNQGDSKSGRLSRADVAAICVQCLDSSDTFDVTFECYEALTAKPVESVGLSNLLKSKNPTVLVSGKERRGETWRNLFAGLERDPGHVA
jgi:uncharacterized protein YbjT (DUF2867 family)